MQNQTKVLRLIRNAMGVRRTRNFVFHHFHLIFVRKIQMLHTNLMNVLKYSYKLF